MLKTGDTMTGNLIINANQQVNGDAGVSGDLTVDGTTTTSYGPGFTLDITEGMSAATSTGVITGGTLTINADPTKFDVGSTVGYVADYTTAPSTPTLTKVVFPGQTGILSAFLGADASFVLMTSAGVIVQQATFPTAAQLRTHLLIGSLAHGAGVIFIAKALPTINSQPLVQFNDLLANLGSFSVGTANRISPNGANLTFAMSGGPLFARAFGHSVTPANPHVGILAAQAPAVFHRATAIASSPATSTTLEARMDGHYAVDYIRIRQA